MKQNIFDKVYGEIRKIPAGKVSTYGEVATKVQTTPRIVGFALHNNPDPKNIPCHRVIKKDGRLAEGYAFGGKKVQKEMLLKEGIEFEKGKVVLTRFLADV